jgi:23S rRNA maturation-related 3'-5' exoribonuclease YhaM
MPLTYCNCHFIDRLDKLRFFDAPASTKRHGAYDGGLFDHSFAVAKYLVELTEKLGLTWGEEIRIRDESTGEEYTK